MLNIGSITLMYGENHTVMESGVIAPVFNSCYRVQREAITIRRWMQRTSPSIERESESSAL